MPTPARLAPILAQYEYGQEQLLNRVKGMTDDEYLWEPVANGWSVRPAAEVRTPRGFGGGGWALEFDNQPGDPPPFTSLAWRIVHLAANIAMRAHYTTGAKTMTWDDVIIPSTAADGISLLTEATGAWHTILTESTDADIEQVGRSAFPWGLDPDLPFLDITWWVNQELLHHGAEIALLRDLYRGRRD